MKHSLFAAMMCAAMAFSDTVEVAGVGNVTVPSAQQLHTLDLEVISIIHFGLNTFVDKEWGFGDTPPAVFNPVKFDARQWVAAAKAGGIKRIVLVCKHHDGFCLWPSKLNKDYTVANSPWKDGKGDIVKEVRDATHEAGLEFAAYLSPWDRHQAEYARPAYVEYFHSQWADLMDNYGPITEIWLDGANGGDGWYGGDPGKRTLPKPAHEYYEFDRLLKALFDKNPQSVVFGPDSSRSMNWPGNETGFVPDDYPFVRGNYFRPPECDTPLRKGWFWHKDQQAKSLKELTTRYFESVGRGGILDLGLAPNNEGLLDEGDVIRLKEFGDYIRAYNAVDFAEGAAGETKKTAEGTEYSYKLNGAKSFNAVDFREDITKGMRIKGWKFVIDGQVVAEGKLAGFRRIARFPQTTASVVKLIITACDGEPAVKSLSLRYAPELQ